MKTVLVTGATGFIGRHCLPLLQAKGYAVHGTYTRRKPEDSEGVEWHHADLLNSSDIRGLMERVLPSHALHFAWYTAPGLYWNSLENVRWLEAGLQFMQSFHSNGGQRLVGAGTCAEYDWKSGAGLLQERVTPLVPSTLYGTCKQSLGAVLNSFSANANFSYAWGRIFFLYGPHEQPGRLVSGLIQAMLKKQVAPCSLGDQVRDVLYVKDVAAAFVALLESTVSGPVNIASGEGLRIKDLINAIATMLDAQSLLRFGERPMPAGDPATLVADVHRLRDELGWRPAYNLQQGLQETISWWSRHYDHSYEAGRK